MRKFLFYLVYLSLLGFISLVPGLFFGAPLLAGILWGALVGQVGYICHFPLLDELGIY